MENNEIGFVGYLDSPFGILQLLASEKGLKAINIVNKVGPDNANHFIHYYKHQLEEYINGRPIQTIDYFDLDGYSDFYKQVWQELTKISFGDTINYKELAENIGNPKAIRAAAQANSRNPLPIVIPCHRVIGSDGSLVGFSLGLDVKRKLLIHEKSIPQELF